MLRRKNKSWTSAAHVAIGKVSWAFSWNSLSCSYLTSSSGTSTTHTLRWWCGSSFPVLQCQMPDVADCFLKPWKWLRPLAHTKTECSVMWSIYYSAPCYRTQHTDVLTLNRRKVEKSFYSVILRDTSGFSILYNKMGKKMLICCCCCWYTHEFCPRKRMTGSVRTRTQCQMVGSTRSYNEKAYAQDSPWSINLDPVGDLELWRGPRVILSCYFQVRLTPKTLPFISATFRQRRKNEVQDTSRDCYWRERVLID